MRPRIVGIIIPIVKLPILWITGSRRDVSGRNKDIWFTHEEGGRFGSYDDIRYHGTTGANYGQGTLPGDYYYKDWNGDGIIDDSDRHPMATFNLPVFNYGITLGAALERYRSFYELARFSWCIQFL